MTRLLLSVLVLTLCVPDADAGPLRRRVSTYTTTTTSQSSTFSAQCVGGVCTTQTSSSVETVTTTTTDALNEVNAKRAQRGLRPFLHDPLLAEAAHRAATFRAERRMFGHTSNDFQFLGGGRASAAGCAAYPREYGFMACCVYDNYTHAGAAWVRGGDGKMYCHLFCR